MNDEDLIQNPADAEVSGPTQLQRLFAEYGEGRINAAIEDGKLVADDQGNVTSIDPEFEQALLASRRASGCVPGRVRAARAERQRRGASPELQTGCGPDPLTPVRYTRRTLGCLRHPHAPPRAKRSTVTVIPHHLLRTFEPPISPWDRGFFFATSGSSLLG